jgi:hypothetical protein
MKSLATMGTRIVAFDAYSGNQLFDTFYAKKEKESEYNYFQVVNIWVGLKHRTKGIYPLTDNEDVVLCVYLEHREGE